MGANFQGSRREVSLDSSLGINYRMCYTVTVSADPDGVACRVGVFNRNRTEAYVLSIVYMTRAENFHGTNRLQRQAEFSMHILRMIFQSNFPIQ